MSTVSLHYINERVALVGPQLTQAAGVDPGTDQGGNFLQAAFFQASFTEGATHAFVIASLMMLAASLVVWIFLDVKHEELSTDGPPVEVATAV